MAFNEKTVSDIAEKLGMPEVLDLFRTPDAPADGVNPFAEKLNPLQVFTDTDFNTRLTNERQIAAQEATRTAIGNTYGAIDSRILKATSIAKKEGESTADYSERAYTEKFGKNGGDATEELQRLRSDIAAKDQLLQQKDAELERVRVEGATKAKETQINTRLDAAINALDINADASMLDSQREFVKYKLTQAYDIDVVDGRVQFTDKANGQVVRDTKTAAPMAEKDLVAQFAPKVVSLKQATSAKPGSGFNASGNNFNDGDAAGFDFSKYTSKKEFADDLAKQGIPAGSKKAGDIYAAFLKARPELK